MKDCNQMIYVMSGYNQRAVIAFLRYLKKVNYEDYCILASNEKDSILITDYRSHVKSIRRDKALTISDFDIFWEACNRRSGVFIPTTEALVRFQLDNREYFEDNGVKIPVVKKNLYEEISDKSKFWKLCKECGRMVPKVVQISEKFEYPIVAKPKTYYDMNGEVKSPVLIFSQDELNYFLGMNDPDDFDIQEYISGESYYLLYYIEKNGRVHSFAQKNILQQSNGKSMIAARPSKIYKEKISTEYAEMLKSWGFFGLIMIEVRKHINQYYMIEANPRLWGPSQLLVDAGIDFFGYFLNDFGVNVAFDVKEPDYSSRYYWSGGKGEVVILTSDLLEFDNEESIFLKYDLYNRTDTKEIYNLERNVNNEGEA